VTAWLQVEPARFHVTAGAAKAYASSAAATRWFCPDCGGQIYMTDSDERSVGVTLGTLDEPEAIRPTVHGWTEAQVTWLKLEDGLPRYRQDPPYDL
jgi:hypothetical protein